MTSKKPAWAAFECEDGCAAPHHQASWSLGCFVASHGLDVVGPGRALTGVIGGAKGPYWQHVRRSTRNRILGTFRLRLTIRRIGRLVIYYPHAIGFQLPLLLKLFSNQSCGHQQLDMLSLLLGRSRPDGALVKVFSALLVRIVRDDTSQLVVAPANRVVRMLV